MKKAIILCISLYVQLAVPAQISVRVRNSPGSRDIEVKTGANQGKPKNAGNNQTGTEAKTSQAGEPTSSGDSVPKPIVSPVADDSYNGPAKTAVTSFYKQAEEMKSVIENAKKYGQFYSAETKVISLETKLKTIKEKDPSYSNISSMEAICKAYRSEVETGAKQAADKIKAGRDENAARTKNESLLLEVIDGTKMTFGYNNVEFADKAMTDYKVKVDEVLKLELSKYQAKLDELKMYVDKSHTLAADRIIAHTKTLLAEVKNPENFDPAYKELQFRQIYWDAMKKIYTGDATCEKYYKAISEMIAKAGSPDDIKKTASKNAAEAVKNRKMAAPLVKDAAMEKILMNGFNSKYGGVYKGTALRAVLLQDGWTIERNNITGIVTGRNRVCELAYKGTDGKCYLLPNPIYIYQAYIGSSFTNTEVIYNGFSGEEMLCENVK